MSASVTGVPSDFLHCRKSLSAIVNARSPAPRTASNRSSASPSNRVTKFPSPIREFHMRVPSDFLEISQPLDAANRHPFHEAGRRVDRAPEFEIVGRREPHEHFIEISGDRDL